MAGLARIEGLIGQQAAGGVDLAYGLIDFSPNDGTKYYTIPHDALLDLPAGAWAIGVVTQVTDNTGTQFQYLLSSGAFGATPSLNISIGEASLASNSNEWQGRAHDDAGVGVIYSNGPATGADSEVRLVVLQSTGTTVEMWHCEEGGTATRVENQAINLGVMTAPTNWFFGHRSDLTAAREYDSLAGGLFWADVLSQSEIEAIAAPGDPVTVLGSRCIEYWRFANGAGATEVGVVAGTVATRNGSW